MHRKQPTAVLVYNQLFPSPGPNDPSSFSAHLQKNLVGEVRIETARFYGSLDSNEAKYPGLNYAYGPHRKRLGMFPHHARLFRAFDELGLTNSEIQSFCRWEGTLWARERFERDEGIKVRDTTGDEIGPWIDKRRLRLEQQSQMQGAQIAVKTDIEVEIQEIGANGGDDTVDETMEDDVEVEDESDEEIQSVGIELNQRLMEAAARREQGANVILDPEWEQYLKEVQERGDFANLPASLLAGGMRVAADGTMVPIIVPPPRYDSSLSTQQQPPNMA